MGIIRKIQRNKARANMRAAGMRRIHKKASYKFKMLTNRGTSLFAMHWREFSD